MAKIAAMDAVAKIATATLSMSLVFGATSTAVARPPPLRVEGSAGRPTQASDGWSEGQQVLLQASDLPGYQVDPTSTWNRNVAPLITKCAGGDPLLGASAESDALADRREGLRRRDGARDAERHVLRLRAVEVARLKVGSGAVRGA